MNLFFARACIAVCGLCVPFMMIGEMWVLTPFLLGVAGILYYASINKQPATVTNEE
jgi:hypothetical protein